TARAHRYLCANPARHQLRLLRFVIHCMHLHRHTTFFACPELLIGPISVLADHVLSRLENGSGTAVVLLELDDGSPGKVTFEIKDVCKIRPAPAINRLPIIADDTDITVLPN